MTDFKQSSNEYPSDAPQSDLLSQIAAEDIKQEGENKSKNSIIMESFVQFMRLTFYFDEFRRKHQKLFVFFALLWGLVISFIYVGGICALSLLVYSYSQFPAYIHDFFQRNQISVQNLDIPEYTFSKIELKNLKDAEGTYSIGSLVINSTFADFLQRRVKSVALDDVTIKISETENGLDFGNLPGILVHLNNDQVGNPIKIDTIAITNAKLELNGKQFQLPISFSLTGVYETNTKISIPFFIKQKEIDMMGTLAITGTPAKMTWSLDAAGTLTLPRQSPENVTTKITLDTSNKKISRMVGNVDMVYGRNSKKINWNLQRNKDLFSGFLDVSFVNVDTSDQSNEIKSSLRIGFDGIDLKNLYSFESHQPIRLSVQSLYRPGAVISGLNATLNGVLKCENMQCSYSLKNESPLSIQNINFLYEGDVFHSVRETTLTLLPSTGAENVVWNGSRLDFNVLMSQLDFNGYKNATIYPISMKAGRSYVSGSYDYTTNLKSTRFSFDDVNYTDINQELKKAQLDLSENSGQEQSVHMSGEVLFKNNPIFGVPVGVVMDKKGLSTQAVLSMLDNKIRISFSGLSRLSTGEFSGSVYVYPFKLDELGMPLDQVSSLFPSDIQNPSGTIAVIGQAGWNNSSQITGPLYVALKDVSFKSGNISIQKLNSVLTFQTLKPLLTAPLQKVFVSRIDSVLPFENVTAIFKLDNQFIRLSGLNASLANIDLVTDGLLLPYKTSNTIVYLKSHAFDWDVVNPYLQKAGVSVSGVGSITLPLEIKDKNITLKNVDIKVADVSVAYRKNSIFRPTFLGDNTSYLIRSGSVLVSSEENSSLLELHATTSGRLEPSGDKKNLRDIFKVNPRILIQKGVPAPIPEDIVRKLNVVIP